MANEQRLTAKHYDGKGYYMRCSEACCHTTCDDCHELDKLVDRLGELEDKEERRVDAVEVVRCEKCKSCKISGAVGREIYYCTNSKVLAGVVRAEQYCSEGERKNDET